MSRAHPTPLTFPIKPMADAPTSMDVTGGPHPGELPPDSPVVSSSAVLLGVHPPGVPTDASTDTPSAMPMDTTATSNAMDMSADSLSLADESVDWRRTAPPREYWWRDDATGAWYRKIGWDGVWAPWSEADAPPSKRRRLAGPEETL